MKKQLRVILAYKNFAIQKAVSHIGLGITAINTAKVMRANGILAEVWAISNPKDLETRLRAASREEIAVTHVNVSAPWIPSATMHELMAEFQEVQFSVTCHSNLGFLQADPGAMRLVREGAELERHSWNFHIAGNSERFCRWVTSAYGVPCTYLPNLYYLEGTTDPHRAAYRGGTLRIGAFGAARPLKNFMTAAGAALQIASELRTNMEIWMSGGRNEGAGSLQDSIRQMTAGLPHVELVQNNWQSWPQFRQTVRHMHLLLQPSYTETFNVVTADGIAEGVPSVVSDAIEWAPPDWQAKVDDPKDIASVGRRLLADGCAAAKGLDALKRHNRRALEAWQRYLEVAPRRGVWRKTRDLLFAS